MENLKEKQKKKNITKGCVLCVCACTWKQGIPVEEKMKSDVGNRTCVDYFENHYFWIGLPLFINVKLST